MADLPTTDELLAQHGGATPALPTVDQLLVRHGGQVNVPNIPDMEGADAFAGLVGDTSVGRTLSAFGHGTMEGFGEETGLSKDFKTAVRSVTENQSLLTRAFRDGVLFPAATALDATYRGFGALIHGGQAAVTQLGEETGQPSLARDLAAMPEAFPLFGSELGGLRPHIAPEIAKARSLGVIGEGEAGWKGTAIRSAEDQKAMADQWAEAYSEYHAKQVEETPAGPPVPETAPALETPDIHSVARQIAPDTFKEYDALQERKDTFRRWIDELSETRRTEAEAKAPHAEEIADLERKLEDATPRMAKKYEARLEPLREERDAFIEDAVSRDSAGMRRVRQELQATDYRMRDLAPEVSAAYREAETRFPTEPAPVEARTAPEPVAAPDVAAKAGEAIPAPAVEAAGPKQPPIVQFRKDAAEINSRLPAPEEGFVRLWRGNRQGEMGRNPQFTNDLPGIALPFRKAYGGELSYVDVPAADLAKYESKGVVAEGAEFTLPPELAAKAKSAERSAPEIAADVSQKLVAAGRPVAEAKAAGALVQARYETRAARLGITPKEAYEEVAPDIAGKKKRGAERLKEYGTMGYTHFDAGENARPLIVLYRGKADASTVIHEFGHAWLEEMLWDAMDDRAKPALRTDAETVLDWLGAKKEGFFERRLETADEITTRQHEKFARGFERYVMEGVAPSKGLARVFEQFREWMTTIYARLRSLDMGFSSGVARRKIPESVREVFDRMFSENPERQPIIAAERETPERVVDRHQTLAETTPPARADATADVVRAETDADLKERAPAANDEINPGTGSETPGGERPGPEADRNGAPGQPDAGGAFGDQGRGAFGPGRGEVAPESAGARADTAVLERPRAIERPAGPNDSFAPDTDRVDKAGNIVLDNLSTTEDVKQVIRESAARNGDYLEARRGVVTDSQALALADAMGLDVQKLKLKEIGSAWTKEEIFALEKLLIQSSTAVRDAMKTGTEIEYAEAIARFRLVQETVQAKASGARAEAGRSLQAFAALKRMTGAEAAENLGAFLEKNTGKTLFQLREEMELGQHLETPSQVGRFVTDVNRTGWEKARAGILGYFINNLISGPITHAGYAVGNTVWSLFKATADTSASAAIGAVREAMAGKPVDRVYFGEVGAQLYGMTRGIRDGVAPAGVALKTGVSFMKGAEAAGQGALPLGEAALRPQAIPGKAGYVLETPSRSVAAIHTLFYGMNYEAEIAKVAYRTATREGLDAGSPEFNNRVARFVESPPPEVMAKAHDEALKSVLMKAPAFGSGQYFLQRAVNSNILAKIVMPFMQVGANILREGYIEHTPLGFASQSVRDNLTGKNGLVERDAQAARIGVGIGLSVAIIGLTAEDIITGGGPSDPEKRHAKEMTGWKPYSIRMGEWYIPHRKYLGPLGPLIGGISNIYETAHTLATEGASKAAFGAAFGIAEVVADESWAKSLTNFIDAARHWDRDGEKYLRNLAMDFLPFAVGMGQVAHVIDPYRREVHSWTDSLRAHIPGLTQGLYPMRDIFGEPMPGGTMMTPQAARHDPIIDAFQTIDQFPAKMERKVRGVDLTDRQYDDLTRTAGQNVRVRLYPLVTMPGFNDLPLGIRRKMMMDAVHGAREDARDLILMENQSIITAATDAKQAAITGPKPKRIQQAP